MIQITQIGKAEYKPGDDAWLFVFRIHFNDVDWMFRTLVPDGTPKEDRLKKAKENLRAFVAALSARAASF